jgi:O-antigen/teichoic acid export membrane protein
MRLRLARRGSATVLADREAAAFSTGGVRAAAARGASFAAVATIVTQVVTLASYVVLARLAPPAVFGEFAAASVLLSFGQMFSDSGMPAALLQRRENLDVAAVTALASTFLGGVLLALTALASAPVVGAFFHSHDVAIVAAAMSGTLIINGVLGVPGVLLQRRFMLRRWVADPVAAAVFGVVTAAALAAGLNIWALVIGTYASIASRALWFWVGVAWLPDLRLVSVRMWGELVRFGRHIIASEVVREAQTAATTAITGRFLGVGDLGRFRFGWRFVASATSPVLAANAATIQPVLLRAENAGEVRALTLKSLRLLTFLAFPLGALFVPFGDALSVLLLGEQWHGTGTIMMILSGMALVLPLESFASELFKVLRRPDLLPKIQSFWTILTVGLMLAFLPLGASGIALAWTLSTTVVAAFALSRVPQVVDVSRGEIARVIAPPAASAIGVALIILGLNSWALHFQPSEDLQTLGVVLAEAFLGAVAYGSTVALVDRQVLHELRTSLGAIMRGRRLERDSEPPPAS